MELGPLPEEDLGDAKRLATYEFLLQAISAPITDDEARALVGLLGPDECYGLAWRLLHLIETAPGWPLEDCLSEQGGEWVRRLRERAIRRSGP